MTRSLSLAPLAVSLGDPAGIGPEIVAAAWARRADAGPVPFFAVGGARVLAAAAERCGIALSIAEIADPSEASDAFHRGLPVLAGPDCDYRPGEPDRTGARLALASLEQATMLAVSGAAAAVVTAPVAKSRLAEVGFAHPGQTEYVAAASGVPEDDAVMMLAGPSVRAVPLTIHIALSDVPSAVSAGLIVRRGRVVARALVRDFGIAAPRLAVAALNPHAGEDGRMGSEDASIIAPAIAALRAEGIDAIGPHPADALFAPHARAGYDVALCMYHDQALIPVKALDFDQGVNVTLGLPIVRTSPDHGTAFDIAGKGVARADAMLAALRMAGEIAVRRAATT